MFAINPSSGAELTMKFFAATIDPLAAENTVYVKDPPGSAVVKASPPAAGLLGCLPARWFARAR